MDRSHRPSYFTRLTVNADMYHILILVLVSRVCNKIILQYNLCCWQYSEDVTWCVYAVDGTGGGMIETPDDHFQRTHLASRPNSGLLLRRCQLLLDGLATLTDIHLYIHLAVRPITGSSRQRYCFIAL